MLAPASETSRAVMQNLHDKPRLFQSQTFLQLIPDAGAQGAGEVVVHVVGDGMQRNVWYPVSKRLPPQSCTANAQ